MCPNLSNKRTPPKFAIANGFVIGSFPQKIEFTNKDGKRKARNINKKELIDLLKAMLELVRPYGCVFAYSGGSQKINNRGSSIKIGEKKCSKCHF
jgi:hypothetical protein